MRASEYALIRSIVYKYSRVGIDNVCVCTIAIRIVSTQLAWKRPRDIRIATTSFDYVDAIRGVIEFCY